MFRVRGLELLFNLQKKNFRSKQDCLIAALHSLLINENLLCAGTGDTWPDADTQGNELLPQNWNNNQDVYSLRYINKDTESRFLLKATRADHTLQVHVALNEDVVGSMNVSVDNHVSDDYNSEYSRAYKNLESFVESFRENVGQNLRGRPQTSSPRHQKKNRPFRRSPSPSLPTMRAPKILEKKKIPKPPSFPRVGGSDLDPTGSGQGGGMLLDPSNMGIPSGPTLPQFGVGGPGGLPKEAVPPGARFDPFAPPIIPGKPNPNHLKPPDEED